MGRICGFDVQIDDTTHKGTGALVFYDTETEEVVFHVTESQVCTEEYRAGQLAKRELPFFVELFKHVPYLPDAVFIDGNGRLHPEKNGFACRVFESLSVKVPVVGIAKSIHYFHGLKVEGDSVIFEDEVVAMKVYNGTATNPVFVSVGGGITLPEAVALVKSCSKYRVSEPIRHADSFARGH